MISGVTSVQAACIVAWISYWVGHLMAVEGVCRIAFAETDGKGEAFFLWIRPIQNSVGERRSELYLTFK